MCVCKGISVRSKNLLQSRQLYGAKSWEFALSESERQGNHITFGVVNPTPGNKPGETKADLPCQKAKAREKKHNRADFFCVGFPRGGMQGDGNQTHSVGEVVYPTKNENQHRKG